MTARGVANYFIRKAADEGLELTQLKLQKLVYYAYAWNLAHGQPPLFSEDVVAWPHGPVVRELWEEFNEFGSCPIDRLASEVDWSTTPPGRKTPISGQQDGFEKRILGAVWERYKGYSGIALSNMTHGPEEPWTLIRKQFPANSRPVIPDELIKKQFEPRLVRQ